jgi:Ca-activated chloride channel homolog
MRAGKKSKKRKEYRTQKYLFMCFLCFFAAFLSRPSTSAQTQCISKDDVNLMLTKLASQDTVSENKKLRNELLKVQEQRRKSLRDSLEADSAEKLQRRAAEVRGKNEENLCQILREYGWPTRSLVRDDGMAATLFLLENSVSLQLQIDLFPVVVASVKRGDLGKADFADFFDRIRVRSGLRQLFGTQARIRNGVLVLDPIEGENHVDDRRRQYDLPPLADYLRFLESTYQMPLVKSPMSSVSIKPETDESAEVVLSTSAAGLSDTEDEVVRIDTRLVNLNVSVFSNMLNTFVSSLTKDDFTVLEDGRPETITFFESTSEPFDLVLLIDLSGSTAGKRELIRKTTQRFIEASRPNDRVAIVTFADNINIVAPMTSDRDALLKNVKKMDGVGGSRIWDALKFSLDKILGPKSLSRRKAIVLMSDGADNALQYVGGGSSTTFADLVETVRRSDAIIIPIYLDTEGGDPWSKRIYISARATLELLAKESGGLYYKARKIEDLNGVYEQVINDLGKVYSLGYRPSNEKDEGWRSVKVQIPNRPDLITHTRPGYYPK